MTSPHKPATPRGVSDPETDGRRVAGRFRRKNGVRAPAPTARVEGLEGKEKR